MPVRKIIPLTAATTAITVTMVASQCGILLRCSQSFSGRLSMARKSARTVGSRIGAPSRNPMTTTMLAAARYMNFVPVSLGVRPGSLWEPLAFIDSTILPMRLPERTAGCRVARKRMMGPPGLEPGTYRL